MIANVFHSMNMIGYSYGIIILMNSESTPNARNEKTSAVLGIRKNAKMRRIMLLMEENVITE